MSAYSPSSVPLTGLTEAVAAGVNLAIEDQVQADSSGIDIGTTMGYIPPFPGDGFDG
jgi:hypothetical protein